MELAMTNGYIELTQNELEIINAGGVGVNILISACTVVGGVAGAAVGTVTVPIFGTVAGGTVGAIAGAGVGVGLATYWGI